MAEKSKKIRNTQKKTLRFQLLFGVNVPLLFFMMLFLTYDYQRELERQIEEKRISLEEEAKTILPGVLLLIGSEFRNMQEYLNAVCEKMNQDQSPGHHIAVTSGTQIVQANAHHQDSSDIFEAMQVASLSSNHRVAFGSTEIIVGIHKNNETTIYVSESIGNIYQSVASDIVRRLVGLVILAIIAAVIVNVIVLRVVTTPLDKLISTVRTIGQGELGIQSDIFSSVELDFLAGEINAMSKSLAEADVDRKAQMSKARKIQHHLIPLNPDIDGLSISLLFQPADEVGGDFYDVLSLTNGSCLFCLADVTGHGISAAMNAMMLKALLVQATEQLTSPAAIMKFINKRFTLLSLEGDFVTIFLAHIDVNSGILKYANAGHEPAWLLSSKSGIQELPSTGMILGIDENTECEQAVVQMKAKDRLLIVSDGVTETCNSQNEVFGRNRISILFDEYSKLSVEETVNRLNKAVISHRDGIAQTDDVTAVLIELEK